MNEASNSGQVVIVGAGIVGIACAHYLSKTGMRITVIDQGSVAGACSHANCGYVCPSHVLPLTEPDALWMGFKSVFNAQAPLVVRPGISPSRWHWMLQFARRCSHRQMLPTARALKALLDSTIEEYRRIVREEALECEWHDNGLVYVFRKPGALEHFAETNRMLADQFGVSADRIEGDQLPVFDPALRAGLAGAYHYRCDASVRPDLLNRSWADRLRQQGVRFIEHCGLTGVRRRGRQIESLDTSAGPMTADRYVFATGAWSARLAPMLGCAIPVEPGKGYSLTLQRPAVCPSYPMLFPEKRVGVSPFAEGCRLGSMMELVGFNDSISRARMQQLRESVEPFLVEPCGDPVIEEWYGWRPMTWDSLPIIGRAPGSDNAYLATGHNMLGTTLAPVTGLLLSELMLGRVPHLDPRPYSPHRFA